MVDVPAYTDLLWPTLTAVSELGGSGSISEIAETVVKREDFSEEQQAVLHGDGPQTEIEYRLAWARTYLKGMGLLTNSKRGVWTLTDDGTGLLTDPVFSDPIGGNGPVIFTLGTSPRRATHRSPSSRNWRRTGHRAVTPPVRRPMRPPTGSKPSWKP